MEILFKYLYQITGITYRQRKKVDNLLLRIQIDTCCNKNDIRLCCVLKLYKEICIYELYTNKVIASEYLKDFIMKNTLSWKDLENVRKQVTKN